MWNYLKNKKKISAPNLELRLLNQITTKSLILCSLIGWYFAAVDEYHGVRVLSEGDDVRVLSEKEMTLESKVAGKR